MNILLIGGGGREHAMAWKMAQSAACGKLYIAPGNPGTALFGENVDLPLVDFNAVGAFVKAHAIDMVVVGPEEPLVRGIADYFAEDEGLKHVLFVGPGASGARLEGSKAFAKAFMHRHDIPTASYKSFNLETLQQGKKYLQGKPAPYVLKADGLAAGKGVIICQTLDEATATLDEMLGSGMFGEASATVVIEDFLEGIELSVFVITDGKSYCLLPSAKDYKRVGEEDTGPNTGGMGAISPVPFANKAFMEKVESRIIRPTIDGLRQEDIPFCGFIFFGLINVDGDPYVIEYNVRLGDPEAEAILPRINSDFVALLEAAARGSLADEKIDISQQHAATVVITSGGYPGNYQQGYLISHTTNVKNSLLFFAGMRADQEGLKTHGGRVLAVTSLGNTAAAARNATYESVRIIDFKGKYYRRDIGLDLLPQ
jgi:phosphoribosylamine---glycine ligase